MPCRTITAEAGVQHILGTVIAIDAKSIEVKTPSGALVSVKLADQMRAEGKDNPQSNELPAVGDRIIIEAIKKKKVLIGTVGHYSVATYVPVATEPP